MTPHRDFLSILDFSSAELDALFVLAERIRAKRYTKKPLAGKVLAMIFQKSSTRTRVSFEVGAYDLGGHALFLSQRDIQLGRGEPIKDMARVLSRMTDGIMIRAYEHAHAEELAEYADVPVINGLTDLSHPCQILADLLTVRQFLGTFEGKRIAWIGDGNNMAHSWIEAAQRLKFSLRLACPDRFEPDPVLIATARAEGADITLVRDPREAVEGCHVVNTDVWASMGQEDESNERIQVFNGYMVDDALMARTAKDAIFLHCLPAHRGEEVSASVLEGPQSRVWAEAENRLHIQKAIMAVLMGNEPLAPYMHTKKGAKKRPAAAQKSAKKDAKQGAKKGMQQAVKQGARKSTRKEPTRRS
ncbi:MAG: ornithine carbamoyltransferase [Gemmatimonadaceae bacterium]